MNTLILPENNNTDKYSQMLKDLIYAVDKLGIDLVIKDLEKVQEELKIDIPDNK